MIQIKNMILLLFLFWVTWFPQWFIPGRPLYKPDQRFIGFVEAHGYAYPGMNSEIMWVLKLNGVIRWF